MVSKAIDAIRAAQKREVEVLRSLSTTDLQKRINDEAHKKLSDMQIGNSGVIFNLLFEDTEYVIENLPSLEVHSAITECMIDGILGHMNLSSGVLKWYAERVKDPTLLRKKPGRKKALILHHTIKRYIRLLSADLGYTVDRAILFVAGAVGRGEQYTRDIWYEKNK
ncbi:hypothetical protein N9I40_03220 [Planktomarina temperata]|jgi:hypothetical protein|nr:hypothetical protein [Planktomarina temperata]